MTSAVQEMQMETSGTLRTTAIVCPWCGRQTRERVLADRLIRDLPENARFAGRLKIVECIDCGLRYLNPRPDLRDLHQIYDYDVYQDSTNNNPVLMDHFYRTLLAHHPALRDVCEIGCGTGEFLALLEERGLNATGVEFADSANRVKFRGPLHVGMMEDLSLPPASFDAVLLLNVIEHLSDPMVVLEKIRAMLRPDGVLLLRHPNSDLFHFAPYKWTVELAKYAYHRRLRARGRQTGFTIAGFQNQHLFYLNRRALFRMLERARLQPVHFSTIDPYNRLRMRRSLASGKVLEGGIAFLRHVLGYAGLGPECLTVARSVADAAKS
jgi:SAM-dependent methyltransferase